MTAATFGTVRLGVFCHHGCASLLDGPTRSSAFWTRWRLITGTRPGPRRSSFCALVCGSPSHGYRTQIRYWWREDAVMMLPGEEGGATV